MKKSTCKSCGEEIVFARHSRTQTLMPFNAKAKTEWVLFDDEEKGVPVARSTKFYTPHFATCPQAQKHRKRD